MRFVILYIYRVKYQFIWFLICLVQRILVFWTTLSFPVSVHWSPEDENLWRGRHPVSVDRCCKDSTRPWRRILKHPVDFCHSPPHHTPRKVFVYRYLNLKSTEKFEVRFQVWYLDPCSISVLYGIIINCRKIWRKLIRVHSLSCYSTVVGFKTPFSILFQYYREHVHFRIRTFIGPRSRLNFT